MDTIELIEFFIHLIKPGETVTIAELCKRIRQAYDVKEGDPRTCSIYEMLMACPQNMGFTRRVA